jgi:hypothetical protein
MPSSGTIDIAIPRNIRGSRGRAWRTGMVAPCSLLILLAGSLAHGACAQTTQAQQPPAQAAHAPGYGIGVIPPPPLRDLAQPKRSAADGQPITTTQAKQQFVNPERAYDPNTGQSLYWDCMKKTWIDSKTDKPVGYQGGKAGDGEIIPPPPKLELADSERVTAEGLVARITQAKQDADNPGRAFDPESKQILVWDRRQKTWIDTRTGEALGFLGRKGATACQPSGAPTPPPVQAAFNANTAIFDDLLFKDRVAIESSESFFLSGAMGQTLLQMELLLTSKQSVIGGGMRWAGQSTPQTDAKPSAGAPGFTCLSCAAEEPCRSRCADLPSFIQLSKTVSAGAL